MASQFLYYSNFLIPGAFHIKNTSKKKKKKKVFEKMEKTAIFKATSTDKLSERFLNG